MADGKNFNLSPAPPGKARDLKRQALPPIHNHLTSQDVSSPAKEDFPLSDHFQSPSYPIRQLVDNDSHPDKLKYGEPYFNFHGAKESEVSHHAFQTSCGCPPCEEARAKKELQDIIAPSGSMDEAERKNYEEVNDFIARWNIGIRSPRVNDAREETDEKGRDFRVLDDGIRSPKLVVQGNLVGKEAQMSNNGAFGLTKWFITKALQMFDDEEDPDEE